MRAPKVVDFYTAAWPDFTPALTVRTVGKRLTRFAAQGAAVLADRSSRPHRLR